MEKQRDHKKLAVIMACHNRRESTLSCLTALERQRLPQGVSVEVYLLDDGSTDGSSEAVRNSFPEVHILEGNGTLFWNRGMYRSFSAAIKKGFDYYLWLNDDTILYEHALETLLNTHINLTKEKGQEAAIIGSSIQDPLTKDFTYGGIKTYKAGIGRIKQRYVIPGKEPIQCDVCNGNCVLIPAAVVSTVGNLDPIYTHRWGDHDYCFRALQRGCTVWIAPGYLGTCSRNPIEGTWDDFSLPLANRLRKLNSPHGFQFRDYAIYLRRHRGPWWLGHLLWPYLKVVLQAIKH